MKHIGKRILKLRQIARMTQAEFGEILGVTAPNVCQYEKGKLLPSLKVLKLMKKTFHCSYDWLLEDL